MTTIFVAEDSAKRIGASKASHFGEMASRSARSIICVCIVSLLPVQIFKTSEKRTPTPELAAAQFTNGNVQPPPLGSSVYNSGFSGKTERSLLTRESSMKSHSTFTGRQIGRHVL